MELLNLVTDTQTVQTRAREQNYFLEFQKATKQSLH